jgi:hypothetical protein
MSAIAPKWISGQKILFRWGIRDFELLGIVKKGLQPYSSDLGEPVFPYTMQKKDFLQKAKGSKEGLELKLEVLRKSRLPGKKFNFIPHEILEEIENEIEEAKKLREAKVLRKPRMLVNLSDLIPHKELEEIELDLINEIEEAKKLIEDSQEKLSKESGDWADYTPRSQEEKKQIIKELLTHIYKAEEVNRLAGPANRKNIPPARTLDSKSIRPPGTRKPIPAPEKQADDSVPVISFYKKDDYWQIGKEGNEAHLKSLKGYELIQFLIRNESESFDPITLYNLGVDPVDLEDSDDQSPPSGTNLKSCGHGFSNLELKGLKRGMSNQRTYDRKTFAQVKKKLEEYNEELKETSDIEKMEEIQEKIKKGEKYLNNPNHSFSKFDKAKRNVRELINRAIKKLHKEAEKKPALSPLKKYLTNKGIKKTIIIGSESYYKSNPSDPVKWKLESN